ncbi:MAG: hypothetical protein AAFU85_12965 [Planctomycetota bacterium]
MTVEFDALLPFAICQELGLGVGYERSFKLCPGKLLANRYLIGIPTAELAVDRARLIASRMNLPDLHPDTFWPLYHDANLFLIGFEDSGDRRVYKLYLEFDDEVLPAETVLKWKTDHRPRLLHRGVKWELNRPSTLRASDYVWLPGLDGESIRDAAQEIVGEYPVTKELIQIIERSLSACPADRLRFVDVREGDRLSFDLNCYATGLSVDAVFGSCLEIADRFGVRKRAETLRHLVKSAPLGHVAAGIDAASNPFLTIYYEPID